MEKGSLLLRLVYCSISPTNCWSITAISARVAPAVGARVLLPRLPCRPMIQGGKDFTQSLSLR